MQPDTPMPLTTTFPGNVYASVLDSWRWLIEDLPLEPKFTSLFGDIFLAAPDGTIWYLDAMEGTLAREWQTREELLAALDTEEGIDHYLSGVWVVLARRAGLELRPGEVYDWTVPPVLGGTFEAGNITVRDFVVAVDIAGQLHRQLGDLPDGAPVSGVHLVDGAEDELTGRVVAEAEQGKRRGLFGRRR